MYGLTDNELSELRVLLARCEEIDQAILYGSRAKGNYKPFSDVDITLVGSGLTRSHLNRLAADLDDSPLPYSFDLSILHQLKNPDLLEHIQRRGIVIYAK